jgi:diguanylate cyclase (GGDEF)-like protein
MDTKMSKSEAVLYHLANRYLRQLLPEYSSKELQCNFEEAEKLLKSDSELENWSQRVMWLSHWDGVLVRDTNAQTDAFSATLSTAILGNRQVKIEYKKDDKPFLFNVFGLIKRDASLLVVGSKEQSTEPFVLSVHQINSVELTGFSATQPDNNFDLSSFWKSFLNFHVENKNIDLKIELKQDLYSYIAGCTFEAKETKITKAEEYSHEGHFLLELTGILDTERLRQWIKGFADKAQVLKPDYLRQEMEQARLDLRTNLMDQVEFKRCLAREIGRCQKNKQASFALLIIDLDHFKKVNDTYGHDFGDKVLSAVADCIRVYDGAARYGGEEFCVLLPDTDESEGKDIAERIRAAIEGLKLTSKDKNVPVTASIGLGIYPDSLKEDELDNNISTLGDMFFNKTDKTLYEAKDGGRNRVAIVK